MKSIFCITAILNYLSSSFKKVDLCTTCCPRTLINKYILGYKTLSEAVKTPFYILNLLSKANTVLVFCPFKAVCVVWPVKCLTRCFFTVCLLTGHPWWGRHIAPHLLILLPNFRAKSNHYFPWRNSIFAFYGELISHSRWKDKLKILKHLFYESAGMADLSVYKCLYFII